MPYISLLFYMAKSLARETIYQTIMSKHKIKFKHAWKAWFKFFCWAEIFKQSGIFN